MQISIFCLKTLLVYHEVIFTFLPLIDLYCYSSISLLASLKRINEMINIHSAEHKADIKVPQTGEYKSNCFNIT